MKFEPGKIIEEFRVDGKIIIFRYPKKGDAEKLMNHMNTTIHDKEYLAKQKKITKQESVKLLREIIKDVRKAKNIHILIEMDGKIAGYSSVTVNELDAAKHTAKIHISIFKKIRDMGIGTKLIKTLIEHSKLLKIKILQINVFELNKRAIHVYEKIGFKCVGRIPKGRNHYGKYCDLLIYYMEVPK